MTMALTADPPLSNHLAEVVSEGYAILHGTALCLVAVCGLLQNRFDRLLGEHPRHADRDPVTAANPDSGLDDWKVERPTTRGPPTALRSRQCRSSVRRERSW
jgi:hypothetical protein